MAKALFLFTFLAVIIACSEAMKCYDGANVGSLAQAKVKDGCGSCLSLNFGLRIYICSAVNCDLSAKFTRFGFKCCMENDLCNSAAGVGPSVVMYTLLVTVAYLLSRN
ncbi:hypothetical protein LSH36_443g06014 [Paralvinella palmiformis]|uniref:Uncharacterized protein n=1 Tax=Paralvinella palmiformis TaxID=53620 RepID=A0AAD9JB95_9ANNE|nr:hypothetical protein LSH36_443g06014 [Paralvinella palmiformis]